MNPDEYTTSILTFGSSSKMKVECKYTSRYISLVSLTYSLGRGELIKVTPKAGRRSYPYSSRSTSAHVICEDVLVEFVAYVTLVDSLEKKTFEIESLFLCICVLLMIDVFKSFRLVISKLFHAKKFIILQKGWTLLSTVTSRGNVWRHDSVINQAFMHCCRSKTSIFLFV